MTTTIGDLVVSVRSKNAGPFSTTFDLFFPDRMVFDRVVASGAPAEVLEGDMHPYVAELMAAIPGQDWFPVGSEATSAIGRETAS